MWVRAFASFKAIETKTPAAVDQTVAGASREKRGKKMKK